MKNINRSMLQTISIFFIGAVIISMQPFVQTAIAQNYWETTGNTGTTPGVNFLGTIDNTGLIFKTKNLVRMRIEKGGNVGIGVSNPGAKLHVGRNIAVGPFNIGDATGRINVSGDSGEFSFVSRAIKSWTGFTQAGDRFVWYNPDGTARLYTEVNGDLLTVTGKGDIGIGTTTPSAKLDVLGSVFSPVSVINAAQYAGGIDCIVGKCYDGGNGIAGYSNGCAFPENCFSGAGVYGENTGSGSGVQGWSYTGIGVYGSSQGGYAGYFDGKVKVTGMLEKAGGGFKIDHPLDPKNQYLYHSFVESPDMKNMYDGVIALDKKGEAMVEFPAWFRSLNKDFCYQLTAIGAPCPNMYIAEELVDNHFKIAGGAPDAKISWQVTGIRKDVWANAHRIQVEEEKPENERGKYEHPELYANPEEKDNEKDCKSELVIDKKNTQPKKTIVQ